MSSKRSGGDSHKHSKRTDLPPTVTASLQELSLGETSSRSRSDYPSTYYGTPSFSNPFEFDDPSLLTTMSTYDYMPSHAGAYPPTTHGKPAVFSYSPPELNEEGFVYPSLESPFSRSMSGPPSQLLPSNILPSSFYGEEFRDAGREIGRQRRQRTAQVRRDRKIRTRKTAALVGEQSDPRGSQAEDLSVSVDALAAHSAHAYVHGSYSQGSGRGSYSSASHAYDPYPQSAYTSATSSYPTYATTHGQPLYSNDDRQSRHVAAEPIMVENPNRKYQCFDHGCNGRTFSTQSNLMRHQREKDGKTDKHYCVHCGATFTRKTARDGHVREGKCRSRR